MPRFVIAWLSLAVFGAPWAFAQETATPLPREMPAADPGATSGTAAVRFVGKPVVDIDHAVLGKVAEVVFDTQGQPAFVVIDAEGRNTALPYATASALMSDDKLVVDKARLQDAPKLKEGEWRGKQPGQWQRESTQYWNRS